MSKRSEPRLRWTPACGDHKPYRSKHEAQAKASWHLFGTCLKCKAGRIWHVWRHNNHWHTGHASLRALSVAP